ncbi:hypothetical protein V6N12_042189 [Hibiscus sabdariffa]|uniref:Uncharacterized protein n=1 Tax=Hibiscus sabdariffa TaxID=183260 RepID=A0ABR2EFL8_9ROSI
MVWLSHGLSKWSLVELRFGISLSSVEGSYVESLVLLDKGVDVPRISFANLAIDSSDSDEWSGEESAMA